jgi:hypothetical protein
MRRAAVELSPAPYYGVARAASGGGAVTTITVLVTSCNAVNDDAGGYAVPPNVQAQLVALGGSAGAAAGSVTPSPGATPAPSPPPLLLFEVRTT